MRDDSWLLARLDHIWSNHFSDVPQSNPVFIRFGRFARLRFGSIKLKSVVGAHRGAAGIKGGARPAPTIITITAMFKDLKIPQEVVDHTIAHELSHYAHGFSSPHTRLHKFPHEGGIVNREMENRGLIYLIKAYKQWVKGYREELRVYYKGRWR